MDKISCRCCLYFAMHVYYLTSTHLFSNSMKKGIYQIHR
uniref:Uncharacterized protein n=1 Tax=Anguilla anguilla TaxID=7936 RepID=A0A0E9SGR2_ANGAN